MSETALDQARVMLGDLAMRAFDDMIEQYGDDVKLEDALILWEVSTPAADPDDDADRDTHIHSNCTSYRSTVSVGLASMYAQATMNGMIPHRDDE